MGLLANEIVNGLKKGDVFFSAFLSKTKMSYISHCITLTMVSCFDHFLRRF